MSRKFIELVRVFSNKSKPVVVTAETQPVSTGSKELEAIKKELGNVKSENQDILNAYEMTQQELESFKDKAKDMEIHGRRRAIVGLFKQMNSSEYALLDNIAQVDKQIKELRAKGWEPTEESEAATTTIRLFYNFFKKFGVNPMADVGAKMKINLKQSEQYEYAGSEFATEKDEKTVQVKAPGWIYEQEIVTRPRVQEVF